MWREAVSEYYWEEWLSLKIVTLPPVSHAKLLFNRPEHQASNAEGFEVTSPNQEVSWDMKFDISC